MNDIENFAMQYWVDVSCQIKWTAALPPWHII